MYYLFQYLSLCQMLKYYGHLHFSPCTISYPQEGCRAIIAAGNRELNFRIQMTVLGWGHLGEEGGLQLGNNCNEALQVV